MFSPLSETTQTKMEVQAKQIHFRMTWWEEKEKARKSKQERARKWQRIYISKLATDQSSTRSDLYVETRSDKEPPRLQSAPGHGWDQVSAASAPPTHSYRCIDMII